MSKKPAGS